MADINDNSFILKTAFQSLPNKRKQIFTHFYKDSDFIKDSGKGEGTLISFNS